MESRRSERNSTASDEDLLHVVDHVNEKSGAITKRRRRACPVAILLALVVYFLSSGCGIAISVLVIRFGLETPAAGNQDLVARILLFVSSCIGHVYILMHVFASREKYVRSLLQKGGPKAHRCFFAAMSLVVVRLSVPVWVVTVAMNAIVAATVGFNLAKGLRENVVWIQLLVASVALLSLLVMLILIETTDRPFATSILSKRSFITATEQGNREDTFRLSISRQEAHPLEQNSNENKRDSRNTVLSLPIQRESVDQPRDNTPKSPSGESPNGEYVPPSSPWTDRTSRAGQRRSRRRTTLQVRGQAVPPPLETIFGSRETLPDSRDSPGIKGDFSWRPPTRDSQHKLESPPASESYRDTLQLRSSVPSTVFSDMSAIPPPLEADPGLSLSSPVEPSAPVDEHAGRRSVMPRRSYSVPPPDTQVRPPATRRPTLPDLSGLPARAAARRKTSLVAREADVNPQGPPETSRRLSIFAHRTAPPPPGVGLAEVPILDITHHELERVGDGTVPGEAPGHQIERKNTTRSRLVRNFSRPRRRSTMIGPVDIVMDGEKATRRTSSFLADPVRGRGREAEHEEDVDWNNDRRAEVRRSKSVPPIATDTTAEVRRRSSLLPDAPRSRPPRARLPQKPAAAPRFSPFPPPAAHERRLKGLGQGSARRLDREVGRWADDVRLEPRGSAELDATLSIISEVSTTILDPDNFGRVRRSAAGKPGREEDTSNQTKHVAQNV